MANPNNDEFVSNRLDALENAQPRTLSPAQARILMEVRSAARRRRVVRLTATAVAVLFLLVLPAAKAVAQTGSLSMESFVDALHGSLQHVHYIIYCLWQSL